MIFKLTEHKIEQYAELTAKIADIITVHEAAAKALKEMQIKKLLDLAALCKEYSGLTDRKAALYENYRKAKKQMQEYGVIKKNVDSILYPSQSRAREQER